MAQYLAAAFIVLIFGALFMGHFPKGSTERRLGALLILTCWAWPIHLLAGVLYGIWYLILAALGKK